MDKNTLDNVRFLPRRSNLLTPFTTTEAKKIGFDFSLPVLEEKFPKAAQVKYIFIRTGSYDYLSKNKQRGKPIGVIAYSMEPTKNGLKIKYGISVHNPIDRWDREIGRLKAERRFRKPSQKATWASGSFHSEEKMTNAALSDLFSHLEKSYVPTRVKKCMYDMQIQYWRFHREDQDRSYNEPTKSEKVPISKLTFLH